MDIIGIFEKLFPKTAVNMTTDGYFQTLTAYKPSFTNYYGGIYEAELCRASIHTFATHCSKLNLEFVGNDKGLKNILKFKPNPWQNSSQFLYQVATILECENTAFIVPMLDATGTRVIGFYPVTPSAATVLEHQNKEYLQFKFPVGKTATVELERVGVLTKFQYQDAFFGSQTNALQPTMDLIAAQNDGIIEGVKNSATIRFMAKLVNVLKPEDMKKEREAFRTSNLSKENSGGVLVFDSKYSDVKQIDSKPFIVDDKQMQLIKDNVFDYFGANQNVIQNKFNEEEWNAYYEGKIEPFAIQISLCLTNMVYNAHELAFNNYIMASCNRIQYASIPTKTSLVTQLIDRGMMTINQGLEVFNMPPVEGGDKRYIRKEYAEVDKLNESQGLTATDPPEGDE